MDFMVMNRDGIEKHKEIRPNIVISVCCPGDTWPDIPKTDMNRGILRLAFHDWNEVQMRHIKTKFPDSPEAKKMVYFSRGMAKQIVRFVRNNLNDVDVIIAHCDAGISRSPGIIAALSKCITGNDEYFFKKYLPNSLVYKLIVQEWKRR